MTSAAATTSAGVWVKLYIGDNDPRPTVFKIEPIPKDVNDLRKEIKKEKPNDLKDIDADELDVYPQGTTFHIPSNTNKLYEWDAVPSTTGPNPLIVVIARQTALSPERPLYEWETIISEIPTVNLDTVGVVTGWRREKNKTETPKLFFREHLVEKKKEVDAFMQSKQKTRLYVAGPPGSGKTSFFLLYFQQLKKRVLVVQYRDSTSCEIMMIDKNLIKRVSSHALSRNNLLEVLEQVVQYEAPFDCFVFDGVRQKIQSCISVLAHLNASFGDRKGIHITSLQFDIKGGDGTADIDEYMSIYSWEIRDYESAYRLGLKTKPEWLELLKDDRSTDVDNAGNEDDTNDAENEDGEDMDTNDAENKDDAFFLMLLERKFYYAGGSARFMFDHTMQDLVQVVFPKLLGRMTRELWTAFSTLCIHAGSDSTVNSMMQVLRPTDPAQRCVFPVSKYILYKAYEECGKELVCAVKAAAIKTNNPSLRGWAFELEQIELIRSAVKEQKAGVKNTSGDLVLPTAMTKVTYDGRSLFGSSGIKDVLTSPSITMES